MGYDLKTNSYTFDFDKVSFPIKLSENVITIYIFMLLEIIGIIHLYNNLK